MTHAADTAFDNATFDEVDFDELLLMTCFLMVLLAVMWPQLLMTPVVHAAYDATALMVQILMKLLLITWLLMVRFLMKGASSFDGTC